MEKQNHINIQAVAPSEDSSLTHLPPDQVNADKWCFTYLADAPLVEGKEKAVMVNASIWPQGSLISISFLDGDPEVQERVKKVALQWVGQGRANLIFDFRKNTTDTDIRISFDSPGSWSVLGTTCKQITDINKPTMNFGWLNRNTSDEELNRVVLHEFGHALGLTHEHLHPDGGIEWNREQVIKDLSAPPNGWSLKAIELNMFKTFEEGETNSTPLDDGSIMMYPIPVNWTKNGFSVNLNPHLSNKDMQFINQVYP